MLYDLMRRMLGWEPPRLRRIQRAMGTTLPKPRGERARCGGARLEALSGVRTVAAGQGHTYGELAAAYRQAVGVYPWTARLDHERAPEFLGRFERSGLLLVGRLNLWDCRTIQGALRIYWSGRTTHSAGSPVE